VLNSEIQKKGENLSDSKENSFADIIKKTITEATRSIAEEPDLEVTFSD